jgi:hypothetical protein
MGDMTGCTEQKVLGVWFALDGYGICDQPVKQDKCQRNPSHYGGRQEVSLQNDVSEKRVVILVTRFTPPIYYEHTVLSEKRRYATSICSPFEMQPFEMQPFGPMLKIMPLLQP